MFAALWILAAVWALTLVVAAFIAGRGVGYVAGLNHARRYYRAVANGLEEGTNQ